MVNFFFCVKKYSGFGDQRERLSICAPFSREHSYCLKVPCKVDTLIISEPSLTSHNETFLAYRLWIAVSSIISGPGCKEWLFFLYIFLPPPPAGCRHRQYARTGFQSVQQYQQHLRTFLKQFSRPTSDFVNKKYSGRNGVRGKSDLCFNVPSR